MADVTGGKHLMTYQPTVRGPFFPKSLLDSASACEIDAALVMGIFVCPYMFPQLLTASGQLRALRSALSLRSLVSGVS